MTLTQLSYIVAVEKFRNFGQAAEACHVTQPTLSMQVQKLEEELGVILFDRSHQPVKPTNLGEAIVTQARHILRESQRVQEIIDEQKGDISGQVRLGVIPTLAPYLLPLFINQFINTYPKVQLSVEELQTHQILERIKLGSIDIGLLVTPIEEEGFKTRPIFYEPFMAYFSDNHPLLKQKLIDEKDLSSQELWLLSEGHCFREQSLLLCRHRKKPSADEADKRLQFESGSLETLKRMIDGRTGFTLLPWLACTDIKDPKRLREFSAPVPTREVSLITGVFYRREAVLKAFEDSIREQLPKNLQKIKSQQTQRVDLPRGAIQTSKINSTGS